MLPGTRRDLLRAFLGLPAVLATGCGRAPALPPGEVVGAAVGPGHRLRDQPPPTPTTWENVPVVIVGGGVAGLSAAWRLARAGFDRFVLLEIEPAPGGTARAGEGGVVPYPWGAHYLPAPMADNPRLLTLLREMGLIEGTDKDGQPIYGEQVLTRDPHERVHAHGQWHDGLYLSAGASEDDLRQRRAFFAEIDRWVKFRDDKGRRAFCLPTSNASDDAEVTALDRLSMRAWMDEKRFTSPRLRWLVDYGCRDDYGSTPDDVSAWAGLFYFASRRRTPGSEPQPLLSWPEGNGRLVGHLAGKVRGRIRLDRAVVEVISTDSAGKRGVDVVTVSAKEDRVVGYHADQVIFAAPQFLRRYLLRHERQTPPRELAAFTYGSWMVANLHLDTRPAEPGVPLAWDNVLYHSPSLGYVVATHQAMLDYGPTILTYYYPLVGSDALAGRRQLLQLGRDEWAELALADIESAHPEIRRLVTRLDVMRWGHAMIRPRPGFRWGTERVKAQAVSRGVHFAHSDLSGLALFEEAFDHGVRAADEVLRARGVAAGT